MKRACSGFLFLALVLPAAMAPGQEHGAAPMDRQIAELRRLQQGVDLLAPRGAWTP